MPRKTNKFDQYMGHIVSLLEKKGFYLDSPNLRWGLVAVASTVFLSLIAIALALYAVYETSGGGCVMFGFMIAVAVIGVLGMLFTVCLAVYCLRHQITEDPVRKDIRENTERIINSIQELGTKIERLMERQNKPAVAKRVKKRSKPAK